MALRKWSFIEDELKKCNGPNDPRFIRIMGEFYERLKVQHQQMMQVVEFVDQNTDLMTQMMQGFGAVDKSLKKLGIKDQIEQMDSQDDDPDDTSEFTRKKN